MTQARLLVLPALIAVAAAATVPIASGADEGSKPPKQILADTVTAMRAVKSLHVAGTSTDKDGRSTLTGDVAPNASEVTVAEGRETAQVRAVGSSEFIKANAAYWHDEGSLSTADAGKIAGRWVKVPTSSKDAQDLTSSFSPKTIAHCLSGEVGTLSKGPQQTLGGQRVIVLISAGDKPGSSRGRLYIAASGPPRLLRIVQTGPDRHGGHVDARCDRSYTLKSSDTRISAYNTPLNITAPPNAIDLTAAGDTSS